MKIEVILGKADVKQTERGSLGILTGIYEGMPFTLYCSGEVLEKHIGIRSGSAVFLDLGVRVDGKTGMFKVRLNDVGVKA